MKFLSWNLKSLFVMEFSKRQLVVLLAVCLTVLCPWTIKFFKKLPTWREKDWWKKENSRNVTVSAVVEKTIKFKMHIKSCPILSDCLKYLLLYKKKTFAHSLLMQFWGCLAAWNKCLAVCVLEVYHKEYMYIYIYIFFFLMHIYIIYVYIFVCI